MYSASSDAIRESNKTTVQRKALRPGKTPEVLWWMKVKMFQTAVEQSMNTRYMISVIQ